MGVRSALLLSVLGLAELELSFHMVTPNALVLYFLFFL